MSKINYGKLLDLGMSDPLTLGMASPLADRIEILGRTRPVTNHTRMMAGAVLLGLAAISAPLTIADAHPEPESQLKSKTVIAFSEGDTWSKYGTARLREGKSFEIVTEDGETTAYRISNGGKARETVDVEVLDSESFRITLKDGEIVEFEKPDLSGLKALKGLESLKSLESLEGLSGLSALSSLGELSELEDLAELERFKSLESLRDPELQRLLKERGVTIDLDDNAVFFVTPDGEETVLPDTLRERIQDAVRGDTRIKDLKIEQFSGTIELPASPSADVPDSIIITKRNNIRRDHSFRLAEIQLEQAARQIEHLSKNEEMSKILEQAMKDLEKAKASLEKAKQDLKAED